jgi:hypothetical protein
MPPSVGGGLTGRGSRRVRAVDHDALLLNALLRPILRNMMLEA